MEFPWVLPPRVWTLYLLSGGLQILFGVLLLTGPGPLRLGRVGTTAVAALGLQFGLAAAALLLGERSWFTLLGLAWISVGLVVPALGAWILLLRLRGRPTDRATSRVAVFATLLAVPALWASMVEPGRLARTRLDVVTSHPAPDGRPLRVGVLADLQTARVGAHERAAVRALLELEPDLILLPGDLFQLSDGDWPRLRDDLRALLADLHAPFGVYAVDGDSDGSQRVAELLRGTQVRLLLDEEVTLHARGRRVRLLGLRHQGAGRDGIAAVEALAREDGGSDLRLVLVHRPGRALDPVFGPRIDLVVAGHTHGGQVQLP